MSSVLVATLGWGQHSIARLWNEQLLEAIRNDYARPTVHARNLFHTSVVMYDAWAAFDETKDTYFIGKEIGQFSCPFEGVSPPPDIKNAREQAISFAVFRLLNHRFRNSPGGKTTINMFADFFAELGYDSSYHSVDYVSEGPAALGNYIASKMIEFGLQDGSNEINDYENIYYTPSNEPLIPVLPGNPKLVNPNRWQPLTLDLFIDQAGNPIPINTPEFLSPEWGIVVPFSLEEKDATKYNRSGGEYWVYYDPGMPPMMNLEGDGELEDEYKWGFTLVAVWGSHLDPSDGVMIDVSPASIGNNGPFPTKFEDFRDFYDLFEGGDPGKGHPLNPSTGQPYQPQIVPRGDYARILAEFWADGPDSETPPGHWFTILNYVNDHPQLTKKFKGLGEVLDDLEWDIKSYLMLGGAMHDVAIAAWGIKGWYDYIRPISAIRGMADRGQCSDSLLPNYDPDGMPLYDGYIELVAPEDTALGFELKDTGKVKLYTWKGPDYIDNPRTSVAGVGWILAENWWPYQRPTFITPPFAGFISGHSTYSRAAAEVLTMLTGDPFFPGGMGEFNCPKNEFLVFEDGPSRDVVLQWATYRDASDQCSLSRIWGGIHPPADDIPGRIIGEKIGINAFEKAEELFNTVITSSRPQVLQTHHITIYPNPTIPGSPIHFQVDQPDHTVQIEWINTLGQTFASEEVSLSGQGKGFFYNKGSSGFTMIRMSGEKWQSTLKIFTR